MAKRKFSLSSFGAVVGSGINIPDPQHWVRSTATLPIVTVRITIRMESRLKTFTNNL